VTAQDIPGVKMQKTKATQDRDQPRQDDQLALAQGSHEESAKVVGKSLEVNNDDVRNQPQQDNQPKAGQQRHEDSAEVVGNSLNVNDNDVRNQNGSGTEAVKGGQHRNPDKKK
jgi:hypothetical protein